MELIEIIKQTIFLILLLGFGIFSLSYSIYKIRVMNKTSSEKQPAEAPVSSFQNTFLEEKVIINQKKDEPKRKTSERFIVINNAPINEKSSNNQSSNNINTYKLQSIRNTGMYKLKFK